MLSVLHVHPKEPDPASAEPSDTNIVSDASMCLAIVNASYAIFGDDMSDTSYWLSVLMKLLYDNEMGSGSGGIVGCQASRTSFWPAPIVYATGMDCLGSSVGLVIQEEGKAVLALH